MCAACAPKSREECRKEGEAEARRLARCLRRIECREDFVEMSGVVKKRFEKLVDAIIAAEAYRKAHPDEPLDPPVSTAASDQLQYEMERLCAIEGVRELLTKVQQNGHERLSLSQRAVH